jgi:hypothetical protein
MGVVLSTRAINLVTNPGFDDGFAGWTVTPAAQGSIIGVIPGFSPGNTDNSVAFGAIGGENDILSQVLTTPGSTYTFSFWLNNSISDSSSYFTASWDNTALLNITPAASDFDWTEFTFSVAGTGADTISFGGRNGPSFIFLTDVSVESSSAPDAASTMAMLGLGISGLALLRRKL